jgi:NAD(P)-dependent dehydrogenase (short-subunit alcohol dehydrogenase family)
VKLKNEMASVTGGERRIGKAIAKAFAREGAKVIVPPKGGKYSIYWGGESPEFAFDDAARQYPPPQGARNSPFSNVCLLTKSAQESSSPAIRIKTFSSNEERRASWKHSKWRIGT